MKFSYGLVFLLVLAGAIRAETEANPKKSNLAISVFVDDVILKEANGVVTIPRSKKSGIIFRVGGDPSQPIPSYSKRIRYKLEGVDPDWKPWIGEMRFVVGFYDKNFRIVSEESFKVNGASPGWNNTIKNSTYTHRHQLMTVPPLAEYLEIFISSAGPSTSMGLYLVTGLTVSNVSQGNSATEFPAPSGKDKPGESKWIAEGTQPFMAKVIPIDGAESGESALCLLDDSPLAHVEWRVDRKHMVPVKPGDHVMIQWNEMYNIGDANIHYSTYNQSQPGRYRFLVNEVDTLGTPTSVENSIEVVIPVPYWQNPRVWVPCATLATALLFFFLRYVIRARIRRKFHRLEQERVIEQERLRIARDIHDDLGTRLTTISLMSGMAEKNAGTPEDKDKFHELSAMSRELVLAMHETIWTVNPLNDTLDSLVNFVCQSVENICKPAGTRCRVQTTPYPEERIVRSEIRHNVILAIKEAVNNAIKHSGTAEISLRIGFIEPFLEIEISDNGSGFDTSQRKSGNGLANLARRMEVVLGIFVLTSTPGKGTQVLFRIPIPGVKH